MKEDRVIYRRKLLEFGSWTDFSTGHAAFVLHRLTGWLLLGWILIHLVVPAVRTSPDAVHIPGSNAVIVSLLAILVFHGFNGIRLILAELGGTTADHNRVAFFLSIILSAILISLLGVVL
ncbi:hypothetical protein [Natribaculum luteum]